MIPEVQIIIFIASIVTWCLLIGFVSLFIISKMMSIKEVCISDGASCIARGIII